MLAADMGAGEAELVAQEVAQEEPRLDLPLPASAVDRRGDEVPVRTHALASLARRRAVRNARRASTAARWC